MTGDHGSASRFDSISFDISYDGRQVRAAAGQTIAEALVGAGIAAFSLSPRGRPRGLFCGMGICGECSVYVDGLGMVTACNTPAAPGMRVWSEGSWEREVPAQ